MNRVEPKKEETAAYQRENTGNPKLSEVASCRVICPGLERCSDKR
jgi:hypothetical protein